MPRRVQYTSPAFNFALVVKFDDGTALYIKHGLEADSYHIYGKVPMQVPSKAALDEAISIMAEDRGGDARFSLL